jgi:hypothetical protein
MYMCCALVGAIKDLVRKGWLYKIGEMGHRGQE